MSSSWNPFSYPPRAVAKALYALLLPGVTVMGTAFARAQSGGENVNAYDWIAAGIAAFVTGGAVFYGKNSPPGEVTVKEAERGSVGILGVIGALLIALALLGLLQVVSLAVTTSIILAIVGLVLVVVDMRGFLN